MAASGKNQAVQNKKGPQNTKATVRRLLHYLGQYKARLILIFFLVVLSAGAQIGGIYYLKPLLDNYILPLVGKQNPNLGAFALTVGGMALLYVVGVAASYFYTRMIVDVSTGTLFAIRTDLFSHLQKLPIRYFDSHTHGEVMSHFTNDADTLRDFLSQSLVQFVSAVLSFVGILAAMLLLSPLLTLIVVASFAIIFVIVKILGKRSGLFFGRQQKAMGNLNGYVEELVEGQRVVKVFNHEDKAQEQFGKRNQELVDAAKGANVAANLLMPVFVSFSYINYAVVAVVGAILAITQGLDLGTLASFLLFTRSFSQPLNQISQQFNNTILALAGAERIFSVLDEAVEKDEGTACMVYAMVEPNGQITESAAPTLTWAWKQRNPDGKTGYSQLKGDVVFENVDFAYTPGKPVLKSVSLHAMPGQKIALVGSTGAGKSTITNLLNRFYNLESGKITYDGIDINRIKLADLRRALSMVLQDTHLFTGTVADNIRYGKPDANDAQVNEAAALANADGFIKRLPQGYSTLLTADAGNLSQGQRQLLAISRAALPNPPLLVLDEATSSIDTRTEALIEKGMDTLMEGRTTFAIAHRLSTVQNADIILVIEHGEIMERGNHGELLAQKGRYYQLYTGALELS